MATSKTTTMILLDETVTFTLNELSHTCNVHAELITEMVEYGLLEPEGENPDEWRFPSSDLERSRVAIHLQNDLGINFAGVALALELLDELKDLRSQIKLLHHQLEK